MKRIGIYEAKTHLSQICEEVAATGEAYLVAKKGRPLVKIVPYREKGGSASVWDTVEESRARYGPLEDFELPPRELNKGLSGSCLDEATD